MRRIFVTSYGAMNYFLNYLFYQKIRRIEKLGCDASSIRRIIVHNTQYCPVNIIYSASIIIMPRIRDTPHWYIQMRRILHISEQYF